MNEIDTHLTVERAPARRRTLAVVAAAAGVAVVATAVIAVPAFFGGDPPAPTQPGAPGAVNPDPALAQALTAAADAARAATFTAPQSSQWIHIENHLLFPSAISADKGQDPDQVSEDWKRVTGTQIAAVGDITNQLDTWDQASDYPLLSTLPTDPQDLLDTLWADIEADRQAEQAAVSPGHEAPQPSGGDDAILFLRVSEALTYYVLPPAVTGALWESLGLIPGVTLVTGIDADGQSVSGVGLVSEGWLRTEVLFDPATFAFVGTRSVAVADYDTGIQTQAGAPLIIPAGEVQGVLIRLAAGFVDNAGDA